MNDLKKEAQEATSRFAAIAVEAHRNYQTGNKAATNNCVVINRTVVSEIATKVDAYISTLEEENKKLRAALEGLVGVTNKEELEAMAVVLRSLSIPPDDLAVTLKAIEALL